MLWLSQNESSATIRRTITDPQFDVPTTLAVAKGRLFTVNARFTTHPTADTATTSCGSTGRRRARVDSNL